MKSRPNTKLLSSQQFPFYVNFLRLMGIHMDTEKDEALGIKTIQSTSSSHAQVRCSCSLACSSLQEERKTSGSMPNSTKSTTSTNKDNENNNSKYKPHLAKPLGSKL